MFTDDRLIIKPCEFFILTHDTSKEIQEDACKAASCKNSTRYLHGGLGSWDPAAKAHMIAYDKQTIKRLYNDGRLGSNSLV
jgi:hypothetical protein